MAIGIKVPTKEIKKEFISKYDPLQDYIEELEVDFLYAKEEAVELIKYYEEFPDQLDESSIDEINQLSSKLATLDDKLQACYMSRSGMMFELILKVKKNM
jgi:hypothetical protein